MSFRYFLQLVLGMVLVMQAKAQITPAQFLPVADTYTTSLSPTSSTGYKATTLTTKVVTASPADIQRIFIQFNFNYNATTLPTGIPANARIYSAKLILTPVSEGSSPNLVLERVASSWNEMTLTHATSGSYTYIDEGVVSSNPTGKREFNVTSQVQGMVSGALPNYGWRIRHKTETAVTPVCIYHSKETTGLSTFIPVLEIQWYLPIEITDAIIDHASTTSATDGSILVNVENGSGTKTYQWYLGTTGAAISGATTSKLSNIGTGWYGLRITGALGDVKYMAFIVGVDCQQVDISFNPGPNYIDDVLMNSASPTINDGTGSQLSAGNASSGTYYSTKSLLKFNLWMDPGLNVAEAKLKLSGLLKANSATRFNASELVKVTQRWDEMSATWSAIPASSGSIRADIPEMTTNGEVKNIEIRNFWNNWKTANNENYGMLMQLLLYNNTGNALQTYNSSDATNTALRPMINFKVGVGTCISWDAANEKGSIGFNVSNIPGAVGPFRYEQSTHPIPSTKDTYAYFRDSLYGGPLDSTIYFTGPVAAPTYTIGSLQMGSYFTSVFDSRGVRILDQGVLVQPSLDILSQNNLLVTGSYIKATSATAKGDFALYADENTVGGRLEFTVQNLSGTQIFGYANLSQVIASGSDIRYGFSVVDDKAYPIVNGVTSTTSKTITVGTVLAVVFENGELRMTSDGAELSKGIAPATFQFKTAVFLNTTSFLRVSGRLMNTLFHPVKAKNTLVGDCDVPAGAFSFSVTTVQSGSTISYRIDNTSQEFVVPYIPLTTVPAASAPFFFTQVPPGRYTISGTVTSGSTSYPFSQVIYVGVQTNWPDQHPNYALTPNTYSLEASNVSAGYVSNAVSKNVLNENQTGWAFFTPVLTNAIQNHNYLRFSNALPGNRPLATEKFLDFNRNIPFVRYPSTAPLPPVLSPFNLVPGMRMDWNNGDMQAGTVNLPANSTILLKFDLNYIYVYSNFTNLVATLTRPSGPIRLRGNSYLQFNGFDNVITSFLCTPKQPLSTIGYFELQSEKIAGYATAVESKLKFTFDEEYQIQSNKFLSYKIFDDHHQFMAGCTMTGATSGGAEAKSYIFDDNRYTLNLSGISGCIPNQFYTLEVTTSTGEIRFLQFLFKY